MTKYDCRLDRLFWSILVHGSQLKGAFQALIKMRMRRTCLGFGEVQNQKIDKDLVLYLNLHSRKPDLSWSGLISPTIATSQVSTPMFFFLASWHSWVWAFRGLVDNKNTK